MSVIYPQISKPGGFGMGLCAGIYSQAAVATPTCFCICRLWQNPVCPPRPPTPPPHHQPSAWMYSTSRSSICFCPPMKRSIIICRMHSWRAAGLAWANPGSTLNLGYESNRPQPLPPSSFWLSGLPVWDHQLNKFFEQHCLRPPCPAIKASILNGSLCMPIGWWQAPD